MIVPTCSPASARVMLPGTSALMIWICLADRAERIISNTLRSITSSSKSRSISSETPILVMNVASGFFFGSSV